MKKQRKKKLKRQKKQRKINKFDIKNFTKVKWCSRWEVLWFTFLSRKVRKGGLERPFQHITKNKKRGEIRVFSCVLSVGASAVGSRSKKLFEKSFFEIFKNFDKIKWYFRCKVLPDIFLRKKDVLKKDYPVFSTDFFRIVIPNGNLNLAYMRLLQKEHGKARLPYSAAHSERKLA